jgi:hypothetical protein
MRVLKKKDARMKIVFSFNDVFEPCGQVVVAGSAESEAKLKEIARVMLSALSQQHVCRCNGKCQQGAE